MGEGEGPEVEGRVVGLFVEVSELVGGGSTWLPAEVDRLRMVSRTMFLAMSCTPRNPRKDTSWVQYFCSR